MKLKKGTSLYHGTRWNKDTPKWWGIDKFPNRAGEDGGVSFTLDSNATPKVGNANIILEYVLIQDVEAIECKTKAEFYDINQPNPAAVCYTEKEEEVVITLGYLPVYLQFAEEWPGWK